MEGRSCPQCGEVVPVLPEPFFSPSPPPKKNRLMPDWGFWLSHYYFFYQYPVHLSFPSTNQTLLNTFTSLPDGKEEWLR